MGILNTDMPIGIEIGRKVTDIIRFKNYLSISKGYCSVSAS
jgi:hypothetical protein